MTNEEFEWFEDFAPRVAVTECGECGALRCDFDHEADLFDPANPTFPFWFDADEAQQYTEIMMQRKAQLQRRAA